MRTYPEIDLTPFLPDVRASGASGNTTGLIGGSEVLVVVFRISNDYEYQSLTLGNRFLDELMQKHMMPFNGEPLRKSWRSAKAKIIDTESKAGTFFHYMLGALAMTEEAKSSYEPILSDYGEFLPARLGSDTIYLFNTTFFSDALDEEQSERPMASYGPGMTSKFVFDEKQLETPPVFHLPNDAMDLFTVVDTDSANESSFLGLYQSRGDSGLKFEEVWNSEGRAVSPVDVNKFDFDILDLISARERESNK